MKKLYYLIFGIFTLIALFWGISKYRYSRIALLQKQDQVFDRSFPSPTSAVPALNILYKQPDDTEGRTVIYSDKARLYTGSGVFFRNLDKSGQVVKIVGIFQGWEDIVKSKDKYILLQDPMTKKELPKARVNFGSTVSKSKTGTETSLAVENLYTYKVNIVKDSQNKLIRLSDIKLDKILKTGDVVIVRPNIDDKTSSNMTDDKGILYAGILILRRNVGVNQLDI